MYHPVTAANWFGVVEVLADGSHMLHAYTSAEQTGIGDRDLVQFTEWVADAPVFARIPED